MDPEIRVEFTPLDEYTTEEREFVLETLCSECVQTERYGTLYKLLNSSYGKTFENRQHYQAVLSKAAQDKQMQYFFEQQTLGQ